MLVDTTPGASRIKAVIEKAGEDRDDSSTPRRTSRSGECRGAGDAWQTATTFDTAEGSGIHRSTDGPANGRPHRRQFGSVDSPAVLRSARWRHQRQDHWRIQSSLCRAWAGACLSGAPGYHARLHQGDQVSWAKPYRHRIAAKCQPRFDDEGGERAAGRMQRTVSPQ